MCNDFVCFFSVRGLSHGNRISKKELNRAPRYDDSLLTGDTSLPSAFRLRKRGGSGNGGAAAGNPASFTYDDALLNSFSEALPEHNNFLFSKRSASPGGGRNAAPKQRKTRSDAFRLKRDGSTSFRLRKKRENEIATALEGVEDDEDEAAAAAASAACGCGWRGQWQVQA